MSSHPQMPLAVTIRKTQPIYFPVALLFLIFTVTSGPSSKFWWIELDTKQFGKLRLGALGICDLKACGSSGLGYSIGNDALGDTILSVPGFLAFHLFVIVLSTVLYSIQLCFLSRLHAIVGQYRKTGWLFWIFPLVVTVFIGILIAGDNIILSDLRKEDGISSVVAQGSFWLPIPAFLFSFIWLFLSWDLHRLAKISRNPNLAAKQAAIEEEIQYRKQVQNDPSAAAASTFSNAWGLLKPAKTEESSGQQVPKGASLGGWGLPSFGGSGQETSQPASKIYEESAPAGSFMSSMWPGRNV